MISDCVRPGLHLGKLSRHNVRLSYFVADHMVHPSGCRSQLRPPQTSVLLQQWSELANSSLFILLCFINDQLFHHPPPKIVKAQMEIPQLKQDNQSLVKYQVPTRSWKALQNRVIWRKWSLLLHYRDMSRKPCQIFLASVLSVKRPKKTWMQDWYDSRNCLPGLKCTVAAAREYFPLA